MSSISLKDAFQLSQDNQIFMFSSVKDYTFLSEDFILLPETINPTTLIQELAVKHGVGTSSIHLSESFSQDAIEAGFTSFKLVIWLDIISNHLLVSKEYFTSLINLTLDLKTYHTNHISKFAFI